MKTQIPTLVITLDLQAPWNVASCARILFVCWTCLRHAKTISLSSIVHSAWKTLVSLTVSSRLKLERLRPRLLSRTVICFAGLTFLPLRFMG
ncbi:hypothetical protein K503DRAFT_370102 [Rhizopogon vinicolor AM-OR11-026]|uniref:Uncharacterized protein n=1 Tax=Rhizopogon vinicolor AM-OR11-026 TaxID=1314800 RepID=A0A1B7MS33_9AGAM|nr:hypothetical protein K503DRAFT_370102 [Rhizopogon vinicolor AM-OR11-026]